MKTFLRAGVLLPLVLSVCSVSLVAQSERVITARGGAKIQITVPMGYSFESMVKADGSVYFKMENPVWGIGIAGLFAMESDPAITKSDWQQNKLITFISDSLTIAKEKDYAFKPLNPDFGTGVYCTFNAEGTDDTPTEVGTASRLTGGIRAWPGRVVVFRITSNSLKSEEYMEAFNVFRFGITRK